MQLATEQELSDFLKNTEKRAFKRTLYHVRDEEAALDIMQDSMIKLATHYGDKPMAELPLLFQRILSNTTLDWFRRRKTRNALFSNLSDFGSDKDGDDFDLLETFNGIAILASNLRDNLDEAFARRFESIIYFPLPRPEERSKLWRQGFSPKVKLEKTIDLEAIDRKSTRLNSSH